MRQAHPAHLNAHRRPWPVAACFALQIASSVGPYRETLGIAARPTNGGGRARCCEAQSRGWFPNVSEVDATQTQRATPKSHTTGGSLLPQSANETSPSEGDLDQTGDFLGDSTVRCMAPWPPSTLREVTSSFPRPFSRHRPPDSPRTPRVRCLLIFVIVFGGAGARPPARPHRATDRTPPRIKNSFPAEFRDGGK